MVLIPARVMRTGGLGGKLVLATLGFCAVFTVIASAVLTWTAWQSGVAKMAAELAQIEQVYKESLAKAIWEVDRESLKAHLDGTLKAPAVGQVVLVISSTGRIPEVMQRSQIDWSPSSRAPARNIQLVYSPYPGLIETVGELSLYGDERLLRARLRSEFIAIVITQVIQSLMLAGLIMLMFTRQVTIHVQRIAQHLGQLTPSTLGRLLSLERKPTHRDELTLLVGGVNQLQESLGDYLTKQHRAERELALHRDQLAVLVQDRTAELEALAQAQKAVLVMSNRLIHAPLAELDQYNTECLRDVAKSLDASDAIWYVVSQDGLGFQQYLAWHDDATAPNPASAFWMADSPCLLALLGREDLATFPSLAELAGTITEKESALFAPRGLEAIALAMLQGTEERFGLLVFGKRVVVPCWRPDELALLAMTTQMLVQSSRNKAQQTDINQAQLELQAANHRLESLVRTDPLTGLPNRRNFDETKEIEFRRATRSGQALALLICDIDFFKGYNDTYGHAMGDRCLCAVAESLRSCIRRAGDTVARIGGEEFAILLPATSLETALTLAEGFRAAVANLGIAHAASTVAGHVTLSIGVAAIEGDRSDAADNFDTLFQRSDQALYRAKAGGRDQVAHAMNSSKQHEPKEAA
jgi:diguanylate cyclase (GGDEF)-like protein